MTQTYVCHGVSGPSRSSFMTAQFPSRFGVYSNDDSEKGVPLDHKFLAELFQNYGYETTAIGKWHVGEITNVPVPPENKLEIITIILPHIATNLINLKIVDLIILWASIQLELHIIILLVYLETENISKLKVTLLTN